MSCSIWHVGRCARTPLGQEHSHFTLWTLIQGAGFRAGTGSWAGLGTYWVPALHWAQDIASMAIVSTSVSTDWRTASGLCRLLHSCQSHTRLFSSEEMRIPKDLSTGPISESTGHNVSISATAADRPPYAMERSPLICFYPGGLTGNLLELICLAEGRMVMASRFWRDKRVFLLLYCPFCVAFAARCCASCRFPGRWSVSSWPSAVTVHPLTSGRQSFDTNWGFLPQRSVHLRQVQQVVLFKLRKSPFLKQLLELVVFFSLVYLLILCSFCSCSLQLGTKLGWQQLLETHSRNCFGDAGAKLLLSEGNTSTSSSAAPLEPGGWASQCRNLSAHDSLRCLSQQLQRNLIMAQGKKNHVIFYLILWQLVI